MTTASKLFLDRYGPGSQTFEESVLNDTMRSILERRSCRQFTEQAIPEQLLNTLLATAFSAPSKSDLQQACVIHVSDPEKKQRIADSNSHVHWIAGAPTFLVWCGDNRRIRQVCEWKGHAFANDHLDSFMNAAVDAGIAMQTFIIAAESIGLGCCPVSQVRDSIETLSAELGLPSHVFPVAGLCVGWPAQKSAISMRLPLETTVHKNTYNDNHAMEKIALYDERREHANPTDQSAQRSVEVFGISDRYGWSEDHSRQYAQTMREDFGRYIRKQGFDLS